MKIYKKTITIISVAVLLIGLTIYLIRDHGYSCSGAASKTNKDLAVNFKSSATIQQRKLFLSLAGAKDYIIAGDLILVHKYDTSSLAFIRPLPFIQSIKNDSSICLF